METCGLSSDTKTPTENSLSLRPGDFSTLAQALDYAARGETGDNFYTRRGQLTEALPYARLREQARDLARRLNSLGVLRGERVALVTDTHPDFLRFFFACQYAGLIPVALPTSLHLGGHQAYVKQLRGLLQGCRAAVAAAPEDFVEYLEEAASGMDLTFLGSVKAFNELPRAGEALAPLSADETAYLQYTSGSTHFPRGVVITQRAVMANLTGIIRYGLQVRAGDRCVSWLPYYHDMGLVGFVLGPVAAQLSVDYLATRDFAMRPRRWLALITENRATISFSPPFGYELCARRLKPSDIADFDLSAWRTAGVGAETIRPETLQDFAAMLRPAGFDERAFLACYGMAECSLAVSFANLGTALDVDRVDAEHLATEGYAQPLTGNAQVGRESAFVNCGPPLPGHEIDIRDAAGQSLGERRTGSIFVRGPSVMAGYFANEAETREALSGDGWLDTGDIGYRIGDRLLITGRRKDIIIIKGRNIWPQDLEYIAEQQPEVRASDASAFSVDSEESGEIAVLVVQCRVQEQDKRDALVKRLQTLVQQELGIACHIELVPPHTLPRTSSGKLSRSEARNGFLKRSQGRFKALASSAPVDAGAA